MRIQYLLLITICFSSCKPKNSQQTLVASDSLQLYYKGKLHKQEYKVLRSLQKQGKHIEDWLGDHRKGIYVRVNKDSKFVTGLCVANNKQVTPYCTDLAKLNKLEELEFQATDIRNLQAFKDLEELKEVNFYRCSQMDDKIVIPEIWKGVEKLALRGCYIKDIHFPQNSKIKRLRLNGNRLATLNQSFNHLKHLEYLELDGNPVKDFDLSRLRKLKTISLNNTSIKNIERLRKKHPHVKIYTNNVPSTNQTPVNRLNLAFYKNTLAKPEYEALQYLQRKGIPLKEDTIPLKQGITIRFSPQNKHITSLHIAAIDAIEQYLENLSKFKQLEVLSIKKCDIENLQAFAHLTKLREAGFFGCHQLVSDVLIPQNWKNINLLTFRNCFVRTINFPADCKITGLRLSNNRLMNLQTFRQLKHLQYLGLNANYIDTIDLSKWQHLKMVILSDNPIDKNQIKQLRKSFPKIEVYYDDGQGVKTNTKNVKKKASGSSTI